jgi:FKBP-type peptidyl-prolyl cis-trans isomerase
MISSRRMNSMKHILPAFLLVIATASCGDWNSGFQFKPPDTSTAPAPYDTTNAVRKVYRADGLKIYTVIEGTGTIQISEVDRIYAFYTLRKTNGTVQESTYSDGNTTVPTLLSMTSLIRGFREGMIGQKQGARVVLLIPPALGYGGVANHALRNDTLRFDIDVTSIFD